MYCNNCNKELIEGTQFCPECGTACVGQNAAPQAEKSKFDLFMDRLFLGNGKTSYEKAGKSYLIAVVVFQVLYIVLLLIAGIDLNVSGISLVFLLADWYCLSKQGIKGAWKVWGLFLIPVYVWIRAYKTDKKYVWAIISTVVSAVGIMISVVSILLLLM